MPSVYALWMRRPSALRLKLAPHTLECLGTWLHAEQAWVADMQAQNNIMKAAVAAQQGKAGSAKRRSGQSDAPAPPASRSSAAARSAACPHACSKFHGLIIGGRAASLQLWDGAPI